jgi:hypothetical protein
MRALVPATRRLRTAATTLTVAIAATLLATPTADAAVQKCTTPPTVFPIDQVTNGLTGTGWTVLQGTTPESFHVTMLGVLTDAIAPGYDAILVKASGANIDAIGGMGPGFSGSPVYHNGDLVGSVSYGLGGDPHYGALTPGQNLVDVLTEPGPATVASAKRIPLTRADRRLIARSSGTRLAAVSTSLTQIPLPLAVTGASSDRMKAVQKKLAKQGLSVAPYRASSTSSSGQVQSGGDPFVPGGVFTDAISYGAVSYAGVGTATIVCGDYVVAFGHLFLHGGGGLSGAALDGNVVSTIPAGGFDPAFKLANIGELRGIIDQDRLAGVRAVLGRQPPLTEVTSSITNLDNGRTLDSTTQIALSGWVPGVAADHTLQTMHAGLDAHQGTAWVTWTVNGVSSGQPFSFQLSNAYTGSRVLYGPADDVYGTLRSLRNVNAGVRITSVHIDAKVTEKREYAEIHKLRTRSTTEPTWAVRDSIKVAPGDTLDVRVPIQQRSTGDVQVVNTSLTVPTGVRGRGYLYVYAARSYFYARRGSTLQQAITQLENTPTGYDLALFMRLRGTHTIRQTIPTPWVLKGQQEVDLQLP